MDSPASSNQGREGGPRKYAFNREGAREREMHLYLPYWGFSDSEKFAQQSTGTHPNVSRDNILTVFAQLAALRMHAARALISLFDKTTQHVVAEATPDLSLRAADGRDRTDALWLGVRRLPRKKVTMCYHAVKSFIDERRDIFVANDLTRDDRFKNHPSVTGHPHNRFYVSVPITSPDDYVIGSLAVLDDRPRKGVTEDQAHLLKELSATIMDHLLCQRAMREEYREERMVRALGLFVKGKSDLNEWFDSGDARDKKYGGQFTALNKRLEKLQATGPRKEDGMDDGVDGVDGMDDKDNDSRDDDAGNGQDKDMPQAGLKHNHGKQGSPVQRFKQGGEDESDSQEEKDGKSDEKSCKKPRPTLSPTTSQLQDSLAPSNVRSVVNRAASMIYQALDVEGAMFIDASVYARRQTVGFTETKLDNPEADNGQQSPAINGGEEQGPPTSNLESRSDTDASDDDSQSRSLVLGHYTSTTSEAGVNLSDSHYVSLSGSFVNHLIDQYPRGKIFHIEEDGSISLSYEGLADDMNYSRTGSRGAMSTEPEKKDIQQETKDIKEMMKVLPDARCIAVYPVWDFQRGRWFTVCVVWTNDPGRVLSEPKDLTYLAAFSNTVMAEVSRLDLEAADRAKSDFISSISHELRSPLHGLLGTVELLQEMVNSYAQKSLIETVYSCGRTLLDTLNHLLDYAKINTLTRPRPSDKAGVPGSSNVSKPQTVVPGSLQDENLSVLAQEVVEGLLAGAEYQRRGANGDSDALAKKEDLGPKNRLITIVDIEWQDSWRFSIYAGAWRRVIMNLFGNALKYTQVGYIRLRMRRDSLLVDGKKIPAIRMTFSDSGRGMSKDFLTNHLYSAFLQEDTTSPGLGVGLHLVHQIVKSLKGQIKFTSEVGKGTDVDVVLPIELPEMSTPPSPRSFAPLKDQLSGMTVSLFTRSSKLGDLGFDPRIFDRIRSSLGRMVSGWFGLRVLTPEELDSTRPDFAIVTEHEYRNYYIEGSNEPKPDSGEIQPALPLIVLSARTSSWKTLGDSVEDSVIFLTQPVSPKTLATAFEHCLGQPERSSSCSPRKLPSPEPPVEDAIPDIDKMFEGRVNGEKDRVLEPVLGRTVNGETGQKNVDGQEDRKEAKNILLVEDNQVNLKIIEMCVKTAGFTYDTAKNGLEALEKFKAGTYNAVVMDISMPVMDGLTATRQMRGFERKKKRPATTIIILTAVLSASMQHEAMMSGVNLFLTKPTPLKQLKEILRNLSDGKDVSQN
ncbi:autoinducer 2 sensor kinase/phosphatase LuxQ [Aspergillus udagawae]|nr:autoinducer 2 sensor kinase/phosphatase LuxQ [Aspergillus udagawae]